MLRVALFSNCDLIFRSLSVYNALMIDFIAQFGEFQFAIINLLILAGLKLAELQACIVPNDNAGKKRYVLRSIAIFFKKIKNKKIKF
jgi:hypothetical protein